MPALSAHFHEILSAYLRSPWLQAVTVWTPRLVASAGLACLLFLVWPRRRLEGLLLLSLVYLTVFVGWRIVLGQFLFAMIWYQGLRWGEGGDAESRRKLCASLILFLSCGLYFSVMNAYRLGPAFVLPKVQELGLSYLFWRVIHVTVDWKRGQLALPSRRRFLLYLFYFPTMMGGPIERLPDFSQATFFQGEAWRPRFDLPMLLRIAGGLAKLFVCYFWLNLDYPYLWEHTATLPYATLLEILYVRALSFYLFVSGANDLTLMFSKLLGVPLSENYDYPYFRRNLVQFWRHWHMTLTSCLRDYIYEPLGGRGRHQALNYLLTMLVCAFWHVTSPAFLIWGLIHGGGLIGLRIWQGFWWERVPTLGRGGRWLQSLATRMRARPRLSKILATLVTFHYVALSWLPFWGGHPQGTTALLRLLGLGRLVAWLQ